MADIATIGFKADTSDLSKAETALDNLATAGKNTEKSVTQTSAAISEMSKPAREAASSIDKYIMSLRTQNDTLGMTVSELRQYEAAQLGASQSQLKIVANLQSQIEAYQRNAAAIAAAEAAENSRKSSLTALVSLMNQQAATIGMTTKELALYKAAQLGATEEDKKAIIAAANKIEAFERSTEAMIGNSRAVNTATGSMSNARGIMQSFGYQIQDVVVQAQMGTNAFMILSQQGSQLASAFGAGGAVFGAVLAVAGVLGMVLAPALMDSKTNADKLAEAMDVLSQSAERNENGILELTGEIKELARQSDIAAKAQLQAVMIKSAQAIQLASKATADMVDGLTGAGYGLYDVSDAMKELNLEFGYFGGGRSKAFTETVTEIGEKFGGAGVAAKELGVQVLKAIKTMGEAKAPEEINTAREYLLGVAAASKMTDTEMAQFIMTVNKLASDGISAADTAKLLSDSLTDGSISASNVTDKMKELSQQLAIAKAEFNSGEAAAMQLALAFDLGLKSAEELTPELAAQVEELVKWRNAGKEVEKQLRRIAEAEAEMEDAFGGDDMLVEIYKNRAKSAEELMDKWSEGVDEYESDNLKMATISEKAAERIEQAFADAWLNAFDGFESVVDGMKNAFKRMLAEMAHMALTRPIMVSMGLGGMLPGAAGAATGGGAASGLSMLGGLGGLGSMFGGAANASSVMLGSGQIGTALGFTGNLFAAGEFTAALGAAMPLLAAGGAIIAAGSALSKMLGGTGNLLRGGIVGDVLQGKWKTESESLNLGFSGGDVTGSQTTTNVKKKFFKNRRETFTSGYDASAIDDAFDAITGALSESARMFGITGADEIIKGFSAAANIDIKGKSEAEVQAAIQEWVGNTTAGLVNAVFGDSLDVLQKEGEGVIDTVNRLSMNMTAVQSITKSLGLGFDLTGKAAMIASTNIVELAGGIDQLSALTSQYYASFYSEAEQQQNLATQLAAEFEKLNITMPTTREGFRSLVDGLDLTSESGQAAFAALMQLVPGMDQYLTALEAQRTASEQAAEAVQKEAEAKAAALKAQGLDLQLRLYEALGQSSVALAMRRQMELEATDETLRALLLQIYAAEDAAAAQRELAAAQEAAARLMQQRQSLEIQLLEATGQSAQATALRRQLELESMDESLRGLQQSIWTAQDAAGAQEALAQAQAEAAEAAKDLAQNAFGKLQEAAEREKGRMQTELDSKLEALQTERDAIEQQQKDVIASYQAQGQAIQDYISRLEGLNGVINNFLSDTGSAVDPFKRLGQIFNEVKAGLLPDQAELGAVLSGIQSAGSAAFGSAVDQQRAMAVAMNQAQGIGEMASSRASSARSQYDVISESAAKASGYYAEEISRLDAAAELARSQHAEQVSAIDAQLAEAQKQLNALLGIDDRILTMSDALAEFYLAIGNANNLQGSPSTQAVSSAVISSAVEQVSATKSVEMAILDSASSNVEALYGSAEKQIESVSDVVVAIEQLGEQLIDANKPEDRVWLPPTMPEMIKEGAPVDREVLELLDKLLQAAKANAEHASKSASMLQEMTIGGIDVRVEA